jgi:hypothetical protein
VSNGDDNTDLVGDLTAYVGQKITFDLATGDPENPFVQNGFTILSATFNSPNTNLVLDGNFTTSAASGTYTILPSYEYEIVTFDTVNGRWRSRYDYNFSWFENFGQTLLGFGTNAQPYLHNQDSFTFHGDSFVQKVTCVSNASPMQVKRYQEMVQRSNKTFSVVAYAEPNESYSAMGTEMPDYLFTVYEGYSKVDYRMNKYSPPFTNEVMAMQNGENLRAHSVTHELSYDPSITNEGAILFSVEIIGVNS